MPNSDYANDFNKKNAIFLIFLIFFLLRMENSALRNGLPHIPYKGGKEFVRRWRKGEAFSSAVSRRRIESPVIAIGD